MINFLITH